MPYKQGRRVCGPLSIHCGQPAVYCLKLCSHYRSQASCSCNALHLELLIQNQNLQHGDPEQHHMALHHAMTDSDELGCCCDAYHMTHCFHLDTYGKQGVRVWAGAAGEGLLHWNLPYKDLHQSMQHLFQFSQTQPQLAAYMDTPVDATADCCCCWLLLLLMIAAAGSAATAAASAANDADGEMMQCTTVFLWRHT